MSVGAKSIQLNLSSHNLNLVSGKNGFGKSTLIEAITFALFGKPFRDIKKGQLINTYNKKGMEVELWFSCNGSSMYVKRGQKPNTFIVTKDGEEVEFVAGATAAQDEFEKIIGINYNSFKQVVVLGTAGYTPFMSLKTPERRKFVEDLLGVTVLADMDKLNKSEIRDINQNMSIVDEKIAGVNSQLRIYRDNQEKQDKLSGDQVDRLVSMKTDLVNEAKALKEQIISLQEELSEIELPEEPDDNRMIKVKNAIQTKTIDGNNFNKVIRLYDSGGHCPTCLQELNKSGSIISEITQKARKAESDKERLNVEFERLTKILRSYDEVIQKQRDIQQKISAIKPNLADRVEKAKRVDVAIQKCREERVDNSKEIVDLEGQLDVLSTNKSELIVQKMQRSTITEMLKDSGIKGSIVNDYIPIFNKEINKYLTIMDADYKFTIDKEFNETIKSRGREEFSYNSFSQGEKARIDLALLFTWRSIAEKTTGIKLSCLILDEVTDGSTDAEGIKAIQNILKSMIDTNVYVISHRGHNPDDYNRHIQMAKIGRFSVMEETDNDSSRLKEQQVS